MYTTDRLILRPITLNDVDAMLATRTLPEVVSFTYEPTWTRAYAEERITRWVELQQQADVRFTRWMIERRHTRGVIGDVFLSKDEELAGTTELGYVIHPDFAGHGYATEAAREALRIGFEEWGVHRIYARVDEENVGSVRVCQHLGMRQEARLIENDQRNGQWSTELVFAMLDRDWSEVRSQAPGLLPANEYYRTLPRRRVGAGLLITNPAGDVLLLETTYKQAWEIPGGACEGGEHPRETARREVREELGLDLGIGPLLVFDHRSEPEPKGDAIMLVYDGGTMADPASIVVDGSEIASFRFVAPENLEQVTTARMATRLRGALQARRQNRPIEINNGEVVPQDTTSP